jgi:NAD(P)-dependent dehydrogenase (short-subunit alcohol dehydrogenase family)
MPDQPLSGRTALVTGANHGIGAATAAALATLGADVAITYLRLEVDDDGTQPAEYARMRRANADSVIARIESVGGQCLALEADLADPAVPAQLFDEAEAMLGPISILVNNGFPGEATYGAAKAALENYTMTAAIELASAGITANVVHPPVTDTGWITDAVRQFVATSEDHVHVTEPAEVAEVIASLCTDAGALVSGNVLRLR